MKRVLLLLSAMVLLSAAGAKGPVLQSGVVVPGHLPYWVTDGIIGDGGTAQSPTIKSIGTVGQGNTICANSAPINGPFVRLCLGANTTSAGVISLQNFGGASPQGLQFSINGTSYAFPFTSGGTIGPNSSTVGDVTCWNNTSGTLLSDCGFLATSVASLTTTDQTLSGGANVTSFSIGTESTGTFTPDCGKGPLQFLVNGGAFTLAAPANDGSCDLLSTNNASAGAISFSGFTVGSNTGDALTTTNTNKFIIHIERINSTATYIIKALQP